MISASNTSFQSSTLGTKFWPESNDISLEPIASEQIISTDLQSSNEALRLQSLQAFHRFTEVWKFNDFWKRANTCDACLCFTAAASERWPDDKEVGLLRLRVDDILENNLIFFKNIDLSNVWVDDLGWWGLLGISAYEHFKVSGKQSLADEFLRISTHSCWEQLTTKAYDNTKDAKPVPGGCANGTIQGAGGVKNTVVNALLLLLATRLYRKQLERSDSAHQNELLETAYKQWQWFSSWFNLTEYSYLKHMDDNKAALIQERPMALFEGSHYQDKTHPTWSEGWVWSADQGLLLSALTDLLDFKDALATYIKNKYPDHQFNVYVFEVDVKNLIHKIALGVKKALVSQSDSIIREAPCYSSFGPSFGVDYVGGRGILARYLDISNLQKIANIDFTANMKASSEALWETRDVKSDQFQPEFTSKASDLEYHAQFAAIYGASDPIIQWDIVTDDPSLKDAVCQAMGLDFLGATIRASH